MKANGTVAAAASFLLLVCFAGGANAGIKESAVTTKDSNAPISEGFVTIGHVPAAAEQLAVMAESAQVKITRLPNLANITIATNCPRNWNLKGSVIRQAGFAKPRGGVAMSADALGSRAIVNGKVYLLPSPMRGGMKMGPDGVSVNGQKLEPLPGTDLPGACDGPDAIEVVVPDNYAGDLLLGISGDSAANVDSWDNGKFECTLVSQSNLNVTKLKSLSKAVLDLRGEGKAEIGDISTKVLVANVTGNGKILVKNGSAEISNATVSGNGSIVMKGKYQNLKKAVEGGQGTIQISE